MPDLHIRLKKNGLRGGQRIVSVDTEWAKNWSATEKFVPFCAAVHVLYPPESPLIFDIENWAMDAELYFRSQNESASDYALAVDKMVGRYIRPQTVFVGHQLSSDLHMLRKIAQRPLKTVDAILAGFASRRHSKTNARLVVRDTRYDIRNRMTGDGGEKLRNVSLRLRIFAVQNELMSTSLTRLYNEYVRDGDRLKLEKLMVLNWRHAFQTALVWAVDDNPGIPLSNAPTGSDFLVTNDVMFTMAHKRIGYVRSAEFQASRNLEGISEYVRQYAPSIAREAGLIG